MEEHREGLDLPGGQMCVSADLPINPKDLNEEDPPRWFDKLRMPCYKKLSYTIQLSFWFATLKSEQNLLLKNLQRIVHFLEKISKLFGEVCFDFGYLVETEGNSNKNVSTEEF